MCYGHSTRFVRMLLDLTAWFCAALHIGKTKPTNMAFKYSSKPKLVSCAIEFRNSKTICTGFIIRCLLRDFIKTWKEKMVVKGRANSLPVCHGGLHFLPSRSGNAPSAQSPGTRQVFKLAAETMLSLWLLSQIWTRRCKPLQAPKTLS